MSKGGNVEFRAFSYAPPGRNRSGGGSWFGAGVGRFAVRDSAAGWSLSVLQQHGRAARSARYLHVLRLGWFL